MRFLGQYYRKQRACRNRVVVGLLLLAYGSAGVLGYGLHAVWDCGHDHSPAIAHMHEHHHHGSCCHHHHDEPAHTESRGTEVHQPQISAADDCPICEFLVQAQSPIVLGLAAACIGPVSTTWSLGESFYAAPLLGTHLARGPPLG